MPRLWIYRIFAQLTSCKLVYMIAGGTTGYGKTQAVYNYIQQQPNAVVRWVQLTEHDNIGSHLLGESYACVSFDNPELTIKLCELGFPETAARFKLYTFPAFFAMAFCG
jgi:hypothetical protein